jgi:hypothetical protein
MYFSFGSPALKMRAPPSCTRFLLSPPHGAVLLGRSRSFAGNEGTGEGPSDRLASVSQQGQLRQSLATKTGGGAGGERSTAEQAGGGSDVAARYYY